MKTLITGGAGFIGLRLADTLLAQGKEVVVFDIQQATPAIEYLAKRYPGKFYYYETDLVYTIPKVEGITEIYHVAGAIGTKQLINPAFDVLYINIAMMRNILNIYGNSIRKIVFTSTAEVYTGQLVALPTDEKVNIGWDDPYNPRWAYAQAKFFCELLVRNFKGSKHTPKWSIARLSNVYGEGMQQKYVVKAFIERIKAGEHPLKVGSALDTRPFTFVTDTVAGLISMMESDKANGEIINIGNPVEVTIAELAGLILEAMGKNRHDVLYDHIGQVERRLPSVAKADVLLDWQPKVKIEDGIKRTVDWYESI